MTARFSDLSLLCHPGATPGAQPERSAPLTSIMVSGALEAQGLLSLEYRLHGNLQRVRLPAPAGGKARSAGRRDELWHHTCLELFARAGDSPRYLEFNFSPDGAWAAYQFDDYRSGQRNLSASRCTIGLHHEAERDLVVRVSIEVPALGKKSGIARWQLGLAAVIESSTGQRSYWALSHPREQPDFHDVAGFCCVLGAGKPLP
jgi:hypothetical protein